MDHCVKEQRKINPREKANFLSLLTFVYTGSLFKKAFKNDLQESDLYEVLQDCNSKTCGDKFEQKWQILKKVQDHPSIFKLMFKQFGFYYLLLGGVHLLWKTIHSILEPQAMSKLVAYFKEGQTELSRNDAFYYASIIMIMNIVHCIYIHNYIIIVQQLAIKIRTSFSSLIYRKALRLTPTALSELSLGNIVTLVTKDVLTFESCIWIVNDLWIYSIQTVLVCYLLYAKMGPVSLIGIGILLGVLPVQYLLGRVITKLRLTVGQKTDERLQTTQETLSAIRIIKMYTWERFFHEKVNAARINEVSSLLKAFCVKIGIVLMGVLCLRIGFYVVIMTYIWLGYVTTAELVFYITSCFKDLKHALAIVIPYGMARSAELYAAIIRINRVLQAEELPRPEGSDEITIKPKIHLNNVTVEIKKVPILKNISFELRHGLTLVTGTVGSGKSSLLKAILQDYPKSEGTLTTFGRISYASQDPWLFPSSIKQNILFGQSLNPKRYEEVIRVCALRYDLDLLDHGDETIVSDRGINLSKGQQARINLARAIYKESEIYLLDDSLTALDAHVRDFIFNECIKKFLKDKMCILVTQTIAHMEECDNVIVLDNGNIKSFGSPKDVKKEIAEIIGNDDDIEKESGDAEVEKAGLDNEESQLLEAEQVIKKKVYRETKKEGSVDFKIYLKYLHYGGGVIVFLLCVGLFFFSQGSESFSDKLISRWVDLNQKVIDVEYNQSDYNATRNISDLANERDFTIRLYSGMIFASAGLALLRAFAIMNFARIASINIHKAMTSSIINAAMPFFDTHFIGNVLNRFSQDLNNIDEQLPSVLMECFRVTFSVAGIFGLIGTVYWPFLIPAAFFLILVFLLRFVYQPTGRSLKRLEGATRSPMVGHLNASLEGITTIRAYKAQAILRDEFDKHQDLYTSAHYSLQCTMRAFGFMIDSLCSLFIGCVVARFIFFDSGTSAGNVGLVLTQVFALAGHVQWGIRQWADIENNMTSVERVLEYTEVKPENKSGVVVKNWPSEGAIKFHNVSLTYHNTNEKMLKNLSFEVKPGEKIGIVGRTGAGKSSIISTLFRLYDFEGTIFIDEIDTKTVQLDHLRQSIAIIPQDPVLFTGTIRTNIDPLNMYTDDQIWEALGKVKLKETIPSLQFDIIENGNNFSSGQKQLICLARAIIRKNKIVVLDEATANMDPETDALLHETIRENFTDCTVFTIAHRLHSVINADKVMVLDRGSIAELDNPLVLLENKNGHFYQMVEQSGLLNALDIKSI